MKDSRDAIVQVTLVQLDDYGPWTVTPEPRPEADLQSLQARLFADVAAFVGSRNGYAFASRFDNMLAVTNGMGRADHERLQATVRNRYPVTVSLGIGRAAAPATSAERATRVLRSAGSAQDAERREVLGVEGEAGPPGVTIAHFDVVDATDRLTDRQNAYDVQLTIDRATDVLARHMREEHDAISFFVGGDNAIAVCQDVPSTDLERAIRHVEERTGVELRVGVGHGETPRVAGMDAKRALEVGRREGRSVVLAGSTQVGT